MPAIKTTFTLSDLDRQWMQDQIDNGEYLSNSEYIRNLIRRDKEQQSEISFIRNKLIKAEQNGISNKTKTQLRAEIKKELKRDGLL